jgi:hypothetical protein
MSNIHFGSLDPKTPLMFADGTDVYKKFTDEYKTHNKGFLIVAPSGAGKTYFINNQSEKHWIDGDSLWEAANAHPKGEWWLESGEVIDEIDRRSDFVSEQAKKLGLWIMGASNNWLRPDAIVLPDWETHKKYIEQRENNSYDGGATSGRLEQVLRHRKWIGRWEKEGVSVFNSIEEAANFLSNLD